MVKRKGLGRGLDALLTGANKGSDPVDAIKAATEVAADASVLEDSVLKDIPVEYMQRGKYQPRRDMDQEALEELAESIKSQGVMQPIVVRPIGKEDGHTKYEIIAGERRWRATQLAGIAKIPAVIRDVPDETAIAMALIENIQREDLNPMEEAVALKRLQDEFELTQQQVADAVGKSRTAVTNLLRLLNLGDEIKTMLEHGDLEMGHARCLLTLEPEHQRSVARQIVAKGLSVRQAEALARSAHNAEQGKEKPSVTSDLKHLEEGLGEHVGVPVIVQHTAKGKGKLVLKYNSLDELDGILNHLGYQQD
ncbi:ParB/RepB/Spo0J family partition protein [Teredinibacter sp. KSP-S5-2]|uniref:ParB/RepB/Spo0J family partition protein n=1 Tax=Teredinibacter sp. KSP-S5-2 TaxID=3034506 RepID=UPI0029344E18|nr:ParB/RepB/Spo0J family partition protein [Teredinibacter sp. KSP-S5-2]WNO09124.1 ParB/RepB/Spo0J family partition protein [Teredinibacter sp. KSP-S5-2]